MSPLQQLGESKLFQTLAFNDFLAPRTAHKQFGWESSEPLFRMLLYYCSVCTSLLFCNLTLALQFIPELYRAPSTPRMGTGSWWVPAGQCSWLKSCCETMAQHMWQAVCSLLEKEVPSIRSSLFLPMYPPCTDVLLRWNLEHTDFWTMLLQKWSPDAKGLEEGTHRRAYPVQCHWRIWLLLPFSENP